ncbi:prephenate dehydrogenase [Corynebacterium hindlerae]|uniref:Prephenate dehydrogenase n=1 Tax=Corynebacterium hindlerae TaxID=699041 RepID=A0A7G5FI96_9CORY|nr:prephenate dehydrogenase [Corynebacterium hindlerae]QMV86337.1 prephenate dehydrogenase [Corynebacterium hindlerae]
MTISKISRPVCILGLGLIGGSLLRDLSALDVEVFGFNRSPSGATAAQEEGFDVTTDLVAVLERAATTDALIVLATPMPAIASLLDAIATHAPNCGFTDVVSVKAEVYSLVCDRGMADRYVGGHPMAGTADSGWPASMTGLFKGAAWVVTFDHAYDDPTDTWISLWIDVVHLATLVGAEVIPSRVSAHDQAVARISHLPHIFAEALAITGDNGGALALSLAAGSFRDSTRVAGTHPSLVQAMCETNRDALLIALDEALELLSDARAHLASPENDLSLLIDTGYRSRIRYEARAAGSSGISGRPILRLHPGAPGWVSQLEQAENLGARIDVF